MTTPHIQESDLPNSDLSRLEASLHDRQALMVFAEELEQRIAQEVDQYHDTLEAEINETANQIALAADDEDDHHYNGLVHHINILKNDQMHFSVTSRPAYMLHQKVLAALAALTVMNTLENTTRH